MQTYDLPRLFPFDSLVACAVVTEVAQAITGAQVQEVRQPTPHEVVINLHARHQRESLMLSADARFARAHLTGVRYRNAAQAPTFCMAARKHLVGGFVTAVRQVGFDRIIEIDVESLHEDGPSKVTVVAELMGKHSNVVLVSASGTVIEAVKRVSHHINRFRETLPGKPYVPPPAQESRQDPFSADAVPLLEAALNRAGITDRRAASDILAGFFSGISPFLAGQIVDRAMTQSPADPPDCRAIVAAFREVVRAAETRAFDPVIVKTLTGFLAGAYPLPVILPPGQRQARVPDLCTSLDQVYSERVALDQVEARKRSTLGRLRHARERALGRRASAQRTITESARAEQYRHLGDLILANLWRIEAGSAAAEVEDYNEPDGPAVSIPLDPHLTPQQNAETYYGRYKRAKEAEENAIRLVTALEQEISALDTAASAVDNCRSMQQLDAAEGEASVRALLRETAAEPARHAPDMAGYKIRHVSTTEGYEIYVGESATANDYLTTRIAAPNDIWLHARAIVSAHVVIRTHGSPDTVPASVLNHAALLCARTSAQKHSSLVAVDYTLRKYVRKPRGAAPGSVEYTGERTLEVTP